MALTTYVDFDEASAAAGPDDMVCGVATDPPTYFILPRATPDLVIREASHEAFYGTPMDAMSRKVLELIDGTFDLKGEPQAPPSTLEEVL